MFVNIAIMHNLKVAPVAQLDRVLGYESIYMPS